MNNVLHHMSDNQINLALQFLKKNSKKNTKLLIIEPLLPKKFFSLQFFLKALDIGNFIRDKKNYLRIIKKYVDIDSVFLKKFGISSVIVFFGYLRK